MESVNKFQSLIILGLVFMGIMLGQINLIQSHADYFIIPFLMIMLYGVFLQIPIKDIRNSFKNFKFTFIALFINFIWTPIFIWILGYFFLNNSPELWIGFIMLMVTPCTDWYLIFTGIAGGNVALGASILPLNFILQLLLLPIYLLILGGSLINIDIYNLLQGILVVLIIPLVIANISRKIFIRLKGERFFKDNILSKIETIQNMFLNLAIIAMFASQGKILIENPQVLLKLLFPVLIFFIVNFIIGQLAGRILNFEYEDTIALNLTTLARNSPIALAIAVASFPDRPLISLALIIGPLIELPVLATIAQILLRIKGINKVKKYSIF